MTKEIDEHFENSAKCWIYDNPSVNGDVKVRDHCRITGKHRVSAHRDCIIKIKLNHKKPIVFHNLKKYDSDLTMKIMQKLGKFNFKINVIPNGLEKYISFNINNKLKFIDRFQLLSSSLESFVKNLSKDDF